MKLWVDGDSCPKPVLHVILKAQKRRGFPLCVVSDRHLPTLENSPAQILELEHGSGKVDEVMENRIQEGDWAITRDLGLALKLLKKGTVVINDRGVVWTEKDLVSRIEDADLMRAMRESGLASKGRKNFGSEDLRLFSEAFDRLLVSHWHQS